MATKAKQQQQAKSPEEKKQKVTQQQGALTTTRDNLPAVPAGIDLEADAGRGMEGADKDSFAIPFLLVLQPMSPAVTDGEIEGAKPGMLMNSVTNDLYTDAFFVPCAFQRRWIRWAPRDSKGGFKGTYTTAEIQKLRDEGKVKELDNRLYFPLEDGTVNEKKCDRVSDTRHHFGLLVNGRNDDFGTPIVIALTSTGIKRSKNFMARIDAIKLKRNDGTIFTPPAFSHSFRITTVKESNDQGTWHSPVFDDPQIITNANLYNAAKAFNRQISSGDVTLATDSLEHAGDTESEGTGRGF